MNDRMIAVRTIAVVSGSRAEYGLLRGLLRALSKDPAFVVRLVVTGAHLSPRLGETWREIEEDGFTIDAKIPVPLDDDSAAGTAQAMAAALSGIANAFDKITPDVVVLLGDRYEILAAAEAALLSRIPVAHIHGGEVTAGAIDDAMRHAITKMAHLHFTAADEFSRRVIQLGEDPARVFTVGAIGLDALDPSPACDRKALSEYVGISVGDPLFLITYHPATLGDIDVTAAIDALIAALEDFPDATKLFTGVNADSGNRTIANRIEAVARSRPERIALVSSLGRGRYFAALKMAAVVIGNSSSGIIEAPAMGTPTVNIGNRQEGRLRSVSVIDCAEETDAIRAAILRALSPEFREGLLDMTPAYRIGGAVRRITEVLRDVDLAGLVRKQFRDIPVAGAT